MKTNIEKSAQIAAETIDDYSRMRGQAFAFFEKAFESGEDPAITASLVLSIIESGSPRLRYRAGKVAKRLARLKAILPWGMFEAGTRRNLKLNVKD